MSDLKYQFNFVSVVIYLLLIAGAYVAYKGSPIWWKKGEMDAVVKEASYGAKRMTEEQATDAIVEMIERQVKVKIPREDVTVNKQKDYVRIRVVWRFTVDHPFGKQTKHQLTINQETMFY